MSLAPFLASPKIRRFLIFIGTLLITSVVIADPASCPGVRCLPIITGNWQFIYGPRYASFDAVIAAAQASFNNAYAPCTITISPNNELPALEATTALNGVTQTTGDTWWSIYQTYGTKYDIRWYSLGTFSESGSSPGCNILINQTIGDMVVQRTYACPAGYTFYTDGCSLALATSVQPDKSRKPNCKCDSSSQTLLRLSTADPVDIAEGFMWEKAKDVNSTNGPTLERSYNSQANVISNMEGWPAEAFGYGWRSNYSRHVRYSANDTMVGAYVERSDGQIIYFGKNGSTGAWSSDPDIHSTLTELDAANGSISGWVYFDEDTRDTETYNSYGNLIRIVRMGGRALALAYDSDNNLISVTDDWGRSLNFNYTTSNGVPTGQVQSITDSAGHVWSYVYDSSSHALTNVTEPDGSSIVYHFENSQYPYLVTGEGTVPMAGTESRFSWVTYDSNQRVQQVYNAGNADQAAFTYGTDGSVVVTNQISPSSVRTRTYAFNVVQGMSKLASISGDCDIQCGPQSTSVNANGDLNSSTDFNGAVTQYSYSPDGAGLEVQRIEAVGTSTQRMIQTDWNEAFRLPTERRIFDASNNLVNRESWGYNVAGQVQVRCEVDPTIAAAASYNCATTGTVPVGVRRWIYTYCTAVDATQCPIVGLLLTATGPRTDLAQTTSYSYYTTSSATNCGTPGGACYQAGDLYQITDALGHVTTYASYDGAGRVTRMTDPNGVNTDMAYTSRGWLASRTVGGSATAFTYMPYGEVNTLTDPNGIVTTFGYDSAHRLTDITDAQGNDIHYTLDAAGNKTAEQISTASGTVVHSLSRSYNALGQITAVIDGLSQTVFNAGYSDSYDANGNLTHSADGLSIQRQQSYDALNRLKSTIDNYNGTDTATANTTTTTNQDALDRITSITDPSSLVTTYTHDGLSNLTALQSPDSGASSSTFDAAGNVLTHTDAKGIVATSTYDALNRKTSTSYVDTTANVTYTYDEANSVTGCTASAPIGRLTRMVENAVSTTYCYDARGNVIQKTQVVSGTTDSTSYSYTAADRLSGETTPDGTVISYAFNSNGRISGVQVTPSGSTSASPTVVSSVTWLPFGPISGYTLGNGQVVTRTYDANYRLTDLTSPVLALHFSLDAMGDITALGNAPGANPATETYQYDPLYHLTSVTNSSGVLESYTYNQTGDRLSKTASGLATGTYSYTSGTHQLASIGSAPRANDANGNTTGSVIGGQTYGFAYDSRQRIALAQANGATVGTYLYNALGQRVYTSAASLRFDYDQAGHVLANYGASSRDYIWLGDLPVATVDTTGTGSVTSSTVNYVVADQLATPRAVTNSAGTVIWSWAYAGNPFGEQQPISSTGYVLNLRFAGQYYDAESGTNYNMFRTYESATGRYLQSDPIGLDGGISTYAYVENEPLDGFDPMGLANNGGERGWSGGPGGTSNPGKHWKDDPANPGWGWQKNPQTGKKTYKKRPPYVCPPNDGSEGNGQKFDPVPAEKAGLTALVVAAIVAAAAALAN